MMFIEFDRAKWRRQEKLENQHALRTLSNSDFPSSNLGNNSSISRSSPVTPPSSGGSSISKRLPSVSGLPHVTLNHNLHHLHPSLHLDTWLAATAASSSQNSLINQSSSLTNFLSHPSGIYSNFFPSSENISSLIPHHTLCNPSIGTLTALQGYNNCHGSAPTLSPSVSPLNLCVNGSTNDKPLTTRSSALTNSLTNSKSIRNIDDNLCINSINNKDVSSQSFFDPRNSSIVSLRLRAKEHVELLNKSLAIV